MPQDVKPKLDNLDALAAAFANAGNTAAGAVLAQEIEQKKKQPELPEVASGGSYL